MIINKVKENYNDKDIVNTYDELPLWAAPFGLKLLEKIEYKKNIKLLDIGCGTGFPSIELAQRLGNSSKVYSIDLWEAALKQAAYKASVYEVPNIEFIRGDANKMPFEDSMFDTVISNNGINNTGDEVAAIAESYRVLKAGGQFIFTVNLPGTMKEFYDVYREVLKEMKLDICITGIDDHIYKHRKPLELLRQYIETAGFEILEADEGSFNMCFSDSSAMFSYHFIRLCFLKPWIEIVGEELSNTVLDEVERRLNDIAHSGLMLTIPYVCFSCRKPCLDNHKKSEKAIRIRNALKSDIEFIAKTEVNPENTPYIGCQSEVEHHEALVDSDHLYFIIEKEKNSERVGFVILSGISGKNRNVELRRIAISEKGKGYGKEALKQIISYVFSEIKAHRLWLDVKENNSRARFVYKAVGFKEEGIQRDCYFNEEEKCYESLVIMSLLEREIKFSK
ncbi:MAG: GNAT family N-acetyltransferase [Bacillota bacterium]